VCSGFDVFWSFGVAGWGGIRVAGFSQCGDTIEKSQAHDDGCINVRNMSSIEEVK